MTVGSVLLPKSDVVIVIIIVMNYVTHPYCCLVGIV